MSESSVRNRIRKEANCKVCLSLRTSEEIHPCDRCHELVCFTCVVLVGPEDAPDWLCSLSCAGASHKKAG
jgi:hypothetical protein